MYRRIDKPSREHKVNFKCIINYEVPNSPPQTNQKVSINLSQACNNKNDIATNTNKQLFLEIIENTLNYKHIIYTKNDFKIGTAIAIIAPNFQETKKMNNYYSIYIDKMLAIHSAIKFVISD